MKNETWHFKWITCYADDSHEMSSYFLWKQIIQMKCPLIFFLKNNKLFHNVICCNFDWHFKCNTDGSRVKNELLASVIEEVPS